MNSPLYSILLKHVMRIKNLDRHHITRYLSCDGSDRIRYETTDNRRGSWRLHEIGTLAIHHPTLHNLLLTIVFSCDKTQSLRNFKHVQGYGPLFILLYCII